MKRFSTILMALSLIMFSTSFNLVQAAPAVDYVKANGSSSKQKKANKVNNSSQAARIVKKRVGGKVLKVKNNGRSGYKVKVIKDNGHIINVTVDAKSGKVK